MTELSSETLHASCVAIGGRAILIEGRSGQGKSDLSLRLIDRGAVLVSDDYTVVTREKGKLIARAPERLAGKMEIRGLGIVEFDALASAPVALLVSIHETPSRLPEPKERRIAGVAIPVLELAALEPSAPIKAELALRWIAPEK